MIEFLPCVASIPVAKAKDAAGSFRDNIPNQPSDQSICDACLALKFCDVSVDELESWGYDTRTGLAGMTFIIEDLARCGTPSQRFDRPRPNCPCCRIIRVEVGHTRFWQAQWFPERLRNQKELSRLFCKFLASPRIRTLYKQSPAEIAGNRTFMCVHGVDSLFKPQHVLPKVDCSRLKLWLHYCKTNHGLACNQQSQPIKGMRLIDCNQMAIVKAEPSWVWVALSYVWGGNDMTRFPRTPQTITDAIMVTRRLGYQYLWVDQYCVDQTDSAHKDEQIRNMGQIYGEADVTIVAASGDSKHCGLPGVSSEREPSESVVQPGNRLIFHAASEPVENIKYGSPWFQRAWTFQEGYLSRRLIVFANEQTSFYCSKASWRESLGGIEHTGNRKTQSLHSTSSTKGPAAFWDLISLRVSLFATSESQPQPSTDTPIEDRVSFLLAEFTYLATLYADRSLTYEADALLAFTGVMQSLLKRSDHLAIHHISGTPFMSHIHDEICEIRSIFVGISWKHAYNHGVRSVRREELPSWSWIAWRGGKSWFCSKYGGFHIKKCPTTIKNVTFGFPDRLRMHPPSNIKDTELSLVTRLGLEALDLPASAFSSGESVTLHLGVFDELGHRVSYPFQFDPSDPWPMGTRKDLLRKLNDGTLSCLLLGLIYDAGFILVVEWQNEETAIRVGSLTFWHADSLSLETCLKSFDWKKVILE
ncbi:heterokaryon incompatibility protein-domain-containing protein [Paraphoma chrysanthemicola]|uniref:Heterokaryon incompatibility protein-domain-containing protein n=1 Tax=Paraphoma chrysanthemicola TaxID=798071 RepID=A0A8K0QTY4_9PLEO|nr:heterokaryon incompatibility protein-domain-containing protein [Paraphoma chrysanthemicola]